MTGGVKGTTHKQRRNPDRSVQQLWQAMRIMRRFSLPDLVTTTTPQVGKSTASGFVNRLRRCGFVRIAQPRQLGQPGSHDQLVLVRDTGPVAPIQRHASVSVYDPNTGRSWGDGGVEITEAAPVPKRKRLGPPSALQLCVLRGLSEGKTVADSLPDASNAGVVSAMRITLGKRGLIGAGDVLTEAGRSLAEWSAKP